MALRIWRILVRAPILAGLVIMYILSVGGFFDFSLGFSNLFRDSAHLDVYNSEGAFPWRTDRDSTPWRNGPVFNVFFFFPAIVFSLWRLAQIEEFQHRKRMRAVNNAPAPVDAVVVAIASTSLMFAFFAIEALLGDDPYAWSGGSFSKGELWRAVIGAAGSVIVIVLYALYLRTLDRWRPYDRGVPGFLAAAAPLILFLVGTQFYAVLIPAVGFLTLMAIICLLSLLLSSLPRKAAIGVLVAAAAVLTVNRWLDPYTAPFAGFEGALGGDPYGSPIDLDEQLARLRSDASATVDHGIDPVQALTSWKGARTKPKLVIVATSGGAYRSAFWTASVLDTLASANTFLGEANFSERDRRTLADVIDNVRLITGASGGMVGAAYFAALYGEIRPNCSVTQAILDDTVLSQLSDERREALRELSGPDPILACGEFNVTRNIGARRTVSTPIPGDSLSAVVQQYVQRDIWSPFWPSRSFVDRGRVLETQWSTLDSRTFKDLYALEQQGARPSVIFSPMLVESGEPVWISNLDLTEVASQDPGDAFPLFSVFDGARSTLRLSTAVRMQATFPYVSPAGELPTRDTLRLVDAGYYENYGIAMALAYLSTPTISGWLKENSGGVIILELSAFPTVGDRKRTYDLETCAPRPREAEDDSLLKELGAAFAGAFRGLTSPVSGAVAARGASMRVRNQQHFRAVKEALAASGVPLEKVTFRNHDDSSLNWIISDAELRSIRCSLASGENLQAFKALIDLWRAPSLQ